MEEFKISKLKNGRPDKIESKKEEKCYEILEELEIEYETVNYNFLPSDEENMTLIDNTLGMGGIKNLLYKTRNNHQYFLIILPRNMRFDEKKFRSDNELSKISMANEEDLASVLDTYKGAVSIMELIYDKENKVKLFIEESILEHEYFRFHPFENKSVVKIKKDDLIEKLIPYLKHEINILKN